MNTNSTTLLSQTYNVLFNVFSSSHHQVGKFICHNHDVRHMRRRIVFECRAKSFANLFFGKIIEAGNMSNTSFCQKLVTLFHLLHGPCENCLCLFHVGHNRMH